MGWGSAFDLLLFFYIRMACEVCWTYRCDMQFLFPCDAMQIFKHSLMERGASNQVHHRARQRVRILSCEVKKSEEEGRKKDEVHIAERSFL